MAAMTRDTITILARVQSLVTRLSPAPVCDDCIEKTLELKPGIASRKTQQLAGSNGFVRSKTACSFCDETKTVTLLP